MDLLLNIPPYTYSIAFVALLVLTLIYIFWDEHQLRMQINDVKPDRQVDFLIRKFRYRSITLLLILAGIFGSLSYLIEELRSKLDAIHTKSRMQQEVVISQSVGRLNERAEQPPAPVTSAVLARNPAIPAGGDDTILHLFDSPANLPEDASLDAIKTRYENALIGSYILHHCKRTTKDEMSTLLHALRKDIINHQKNNKNAQVDPQAFYASIVTAAEGSFQMMYSQTACDSAEVDMLEQQYANFVMQYNAKAPASSRH